MHFYHDEAIYETMEAMLQSHMYHVYIYLHNATFCQTVII